MSKAPPPLLVQYLDWSSSPTFPFRYGLIIDSPSFLIVGSRVAHVLNFSPFLLPPGDFSHPSLPPAFCNAFWLARTYSGRFSPSLPLAGRPPVHGPPYRRPSLRLNFFHLFPNGHIRWWRSPPPSLATIFYSFLDTMSSSHIDHFDLPIFSSPVLPPPF